MIDSFASPHFRADGVCHVTQRQRVIEIHLLLLFLEHFVNERISMPEIYDMCVIVVANLYSNSYSYS